MSRILASVVLLVTSTMFVGTCSSASPVAAGGIQGGGPTLTIISPKAGETITPPTAVRFAVAGSTQSNRDRIVVFMRDVADSPRVMLEPSNEAGLAYLPDNKLYTGRRDLTFVLATADGTMLENAEARVTVVGVIIEGRR
jgi:hypothetical protein